MAEKRDMSQREFEAACKRAGFVPEGFLGYYRLPCGVHVSILNAGDRRREQLKYLHDQQSKLSKQFA